MSRVSNIQSKLPSTVWGSVGQTGRNAPAHASTPIPATQPWNPLAQRADWLDEEFRKEYMEATIEQDLAYQLRFNREARGLSQESLAKMIGTKQSVISRYEDTTYGSYNINTLVKIAHAFRCALSVRFISFSELAYQTSKTGKEAYIVPDFNEEKKLIERNI